MSSNLRDLVSRYKAGQHIGIFSVCSANDLVLKAALRFAVATGGVVLIESTANQVNQYGGYMDMLPQDFAKHVLSLAKEAGLPADRLLLGGDHLGPLAWANEPSAVCMEKAKTLISDYIKAGYQKIHIDTSMRLQDDPQDQALDGLVIARRAAVLFRTAKETLEQLGIPETNWPCFVIGSEVPVPGGAVEETLHVAVTKPADLDNTLQQFKTALQEEGLEMFWAHIVAIVVQPGVEFSDTEVLPYSRKAARDLVLALQKYPGLVFEGHSTDYQPKHCLRELVEDGVCILKVGPALTFALREALFALDLIDAELCKLTGRAPASLRATIKQVMKEDPKHWIKYYHGSEAEQSYKMVYSLSDRLRYYWPVPQIHQAVTRLIGGLQEVELPIGLLSQYLPVQAAKVRDGLLAAQPENLAIDYIGEVLSVYQQAIT